MIRILGKGRCERILPFGRKASVALDRYPRARARHRYADSEALWLGQWILPLSRTSDGRMSAWQRRGSDDAGQFTPEFKRDAVELVRATCRPIAHIAAALGIYDSTLGNWVKQAQIDRGEREGLTSDEQARLRALEAENVRLRSDIRKRGAWRPTPTAAP